MEADSERELDALGIVNVGEVLTAGLAVCPGDDPSIRVSREFDDRLRVACGRVELERIVVALLRNAVDSLAAEPAEARAIRVAAWRNADERILVEISDSGGGIADEDYAHVFEARDGSAYAADHTRYGLAECQQFLETWGGALYIRATSTRGTSFRLELPSRPPSRS